MPTVLFSTCLVLWDECSFTVRTAGLNLVVLNEFLLSLEPELEPKTRIPIFRVRISSSDFELGSRVRISRQDFDSGFRSGFRVRISSHDFDSVSPVLSIFPKISSNAKLCTSENREERCVSTQTG